MVLTQDRAAIQRTLADPENCLSRAPTANSRLSGHLEASFRVRYSTGIDHPPRPSVVTGSTHVVDSSSSTPGSKASRLSSTREVTRADHHNVVRVKFALRPFEIGIARRLVGHGTRRGD